MRLKRKGLKLLALFLGLSLVAAACGSDDDEGSHRGHRPSTEPSKGRQAASFVDLGTFVGDPPEHIDPALNSTLDAYQVINAVYDGLTDIDATDPANPEIVPHVAESFESNDDASVWTFTIRDDHGLLRRRGDRAEHLRERRGSAPPTSPVTTATCSTFIDGGAERLDGSGRHHLRRRRRRRRHDPHGHPRRAVLELPGGRRLPAVHAGPARRPSTAGADWENGIMIGNGPYKMEAARTDEEIILVKNDDWTGDVNGETWDDRLDKITFRDLRRPRHRVQRVRGRRGRQRQHPARPGRGRAGQLRHHARRRDPRARTTS